jgi:ribonuclease inhibitor
MEMKVEKIEIDGLLIKTSQDFHQQLAAALEIGEHYGANLHALWDVLSSDVERPVHIVWRNSALSERQLGAEYLKITEVIKRAVAQDERQGWDERLTLSLE